MAMRVEQDLRVRPHATWFLLPIAMFVVAVVLFVVAISTIAHLVNGRLVRVPTTPDTSSAGVSGQVTGQITVLSQGRTIWTGTKGSDATCALQPANGGDQQVELDTFPFEFEFPHGGRSYYAVGVTPSDTAAGVYELVCSDTTDGERFAAGPRIDTTALATRFIWGIALPIVLVLAGVIIVIVLMVRRHGSKSRLRAMRAHAASGYGAAWNQTYRPGNGPPPPPPPAPPQQPPDPPQAPASSD